MNWQCTANGEEPTGRPVPFVITSWSTGGPVAAAPQAFEVRGAYLDDHDGDQGGDHVEDGGHHERGRDTGGEIWSDQGDGRCPVRPIAAVRPGWPAPGTRGPGCAPRRGAGSRPARTLRSVPSHVRCRTSGRTYEHLREDVDNRRVAGVRHAEVVDSSLFATLLNIADGVHFSSWYVVCCGARGLAPPGLTTRRPVPDRGERPADSCGRVSADPLRACPAAPGRRGPEVPPLSWR